MTPDTATLLAQRALKQVDNGRCSCHITADQLAELATCYICLTERARQVQALVQQARLCLGDHHLDYDQDPCVRSVLDEIERLVAE